MHSPEHVRAVDRPPISCDTSQWQSYVDRWRRREWRTSIFVDLILNDAKRFSHDLTLLDIGCGRGFDDDPAAQKKLAAYSDCYIGIEPDPEMAVVADFDEVQHCTLEQSSVKPASVDIAWAVMVLEHVEQPAAFWNKVHEVLREGGVFWGFTVDRRHPFPWLVQAMDKVGIKDRYLRRLRGKNGNDSYEHYPTYYRSNSPRQVTPYVQEFRRCDFINFDRIGQLDGYLPKWARPAGRLLDRFQMALKRPGVLLAIRCEK
jgi:SAM-dependent methyltransferase